MMEASQLQNWMENMNQSLCFRDGCQGNLVICDQAKKGLGGAARFQIACNSWGKDYSWNTSSLIPGTQHQVISTSLLLSSLLNGSLYSGYEKGMGIVIGDCLVSDQSWSNFVHWLHPIVKNLLDDQCKQVKEKIKEIPDEEFGSWKRAITTCDGGWQTRGFHSKNATFVFGELSQPRVG